MLFWVFRNNYFGIGRRRNQVYILVLLLLIVFMTVFSIIDNIYEMKQRKSLWNALETDEIIRVRSIIRSHPHHINSRNEDGLSPVQKAIVNGNTECAWYLACQGAGLRIRTEDGKSLLHLAAEYGDEGMVRLFAGIAADPDLIDSNGSAPLHASVCSGKTGNVQAIIERGAFIDQKDSEGNTPLLLAIHLGHEEIASLLVEFGAETEIRDSEGNTPLINSLRKGAVNVTQSLISRKASLDVIGSDGLAALHIASEKGYIEIMESLIESGADVNVQSARRSGNITLSETNAMNQHLISTHGLTPLHIAVICRLDQAVSTLIRRGASGSIRDSSGRIPYDMALKSASQKMIEMLSIEKNRGTAGHFSSCLE
jgi:ankyrin repeat protein